MQKQIENKLTVEKGLNEAFCDSALLLSLFPKRSECRSADFKRTHS